MYIFITLLLLHCCNAYRKQKLTKLFKNNKNYKNQFSLFEVFSQSFFPSFCQLERSVLHSLKVERYLARNSLAPLRYAFTLQEKVLNGYKLQLPLRVGPTIESPSFHGQIYLRPHLGIPTKLTGFVGPLMNF